VDIIGTAETVEDVIGKNKFQDKKRKSSFRIDYLHVWLTEHVEALSEDTGIKGIDAKYKSWKPCQRRRIR